MSAARCPRTFEVEAVRDGRLGGAERASFEQHLARCAACAAEVRALDAMARALSALPEPTTDDLHSRRERTRLLAAFDATLVRPETSRGARLSWIALGTAAAVVATMLLLRAFPREAAPLASTPVVRAVGVATWSSEREGRRERIVLERGTLFVQVEHPSSIEKLVVALPDGELEDVGTTFTVTAADGRTTGVDVQEGTVVLRLRGQSPLTIHAGSTFQPAKVTSLEPSVPASASATLPPFASAPQTPSRTPARATLRATRAAEPPASHSGAPPAEPDETATAFRAAMAAFDAGELGVAASRFSSFVAEHPRDPRAEDAAYLRVLALQRRGDEGGVRRAAEDYLRRFPNGFRRAEVDRMLQPSR